MIPWMWFGLSLSLAAQTTADSSLLTIDRLFGSSEFLIESVPSIRWINGGEAYIISEPGKKNDTWEDLVKVETRSQKRSLYIPAEKLIPAGDSIPLTIEHFTLSPDESKVLIFNNSSRVWRSNTKGDFWVYDLLNQQLIRIGSRFPPSSLMFAKFSHDNRYVAYVHDFNIYIESLTDGFIKQITFDGTGDIINGTFDWVYEEEFGCRDGFRWNQSGGHIAFWQLDASSTGTFYMINNTDSVYSRIIPLQYPKVGQSPSACRLGIIDLSGTEVTWIPVPGDEKENYIPRMQWINDKLLLIQQINRRQNHLKFYTYNIASRALRMIYEEHDTAWVDITYPDISVDGWEMEDLIAINQGKEVLRLSETGDWRHLYKINLVSGQVTNLTQGEYDVARYYTADNKYVYFSASPKNSTQRYLYRVSLSGRADTLRITPMEYAGVNLYGISPNSQYAIHTHTSIHSPPSTNLISIPDHSILQGITDNKNYRQNIAQLKMPAATFFSVTTADGTEMDGWMIKPPDFDDSGRYPVLFYVYGEPWEQVAADTWKSLWYVMLAQQGYVIMALDNRGSPCLKGSAWRKCLYRKIGIINAGDQAMAVKEILKWDFIDTTRVAVWGWSGGGSMTLNLMFRYPGIYKTGMAVAAVSDLRTYDNIYTERYMGLPSENMAAYSEGSPKNFAGNLQGNLLIVHGTGDDNVHYQNTELLVNELIRYNKTFTMMAYPNRSHSIYEGFNTRRHLYTLLTNYLKEYCPPRGESE